MTGIYIHIPFCSKACTYCNFHFSTQLKFTQNFVEALCTEIALRTNPALQIHTVYFGGGTPSLLNKVQLEQIFTCLHKYFNLKKTVEISFELNPENVNPDYIKALKAFGVNRVSMGIQTFDEASLKWMNRSHSKDQAHKALEYLVTCGIENISCDLIYALPKQSLALLAEDIETLMSYNIPHISSYLLTVEEKTAYAAQLQKNTIQEADELIVEQQFTYLVSALKKHGLEQYEISNFAKPGWESIHNGNYWAGIPYLGFGPAAHSFDGTKREWNIANNQSYIKSLSEKERPYESETLSKIDRYNELVFTQLRRKQGLNLNELTEITGFDLELLFKKELMRNKDKGFINLLKENLVLTQKGKLFADAVATDFFLTNI